jgi:hypothetical protein
MQCPMAKRVNVTVNTPRAFARTTFVRLPVVLTVTVTRSRAWKPVPRIVTGAVDCIATRARVFAVAVEAPTSAISMTTSAVRIRRNGTPPGGISNASAAVRLGHLAVVEGLVEDRILDALIARHLAKRAA